MANFTMMNWRHFASIAEQTTSAVPSPIDFTLIPVSNFNLGSKQSFEIPALVASVTDAFIYQQGIITVDGEISGPLTINISNTLLKNAISLFADPSRELAIFSSLHGMFTGGKVNSFTITANAEEPINFSANVWARKGDLENPFTGHTTNITDVDAGYSEDRESVSIYDPYNTEYNPTMYDSEIPRSPEQQVVENPNPPPITINGHHSGSEILQIPMFDTVYGAKYLLPFSSTIEEEADSFGLPISINLTIDNKLQRNYVLGSYYDSTNEKNDGLYAYSLSAAQREISGTITWQTGSSDAFRFIKAVRTKQLGAVKLSFGGTNLTNTSGNDAPLMEIDLEDCTVIFDAAPPPLDPGSKTTGTTNFRILKNGIIPIKYT